MINLSIFLANIHVSILGHMVSILGVSNLSIFLADQSFHVLADQSFCVSCWFPCFNPRRYGFHPGCIQSFYTSRWLIFPCFSLINLSMFQSSAIWLTLVYQFPSRTRCRLPTQQPLPCGRRGPIPSATPASSSTRAATGALPTRLPSAERPAMSHSSSSSHHLLALDARRLSTTQ